MSHPYYPPSAVLPDYVPSSWPILYTVGAFWPIVAVVSVMAYRLVADAPLKDRLAAAWFALCGFLHIAFEGYFVYYRSDLAGMNTLFAQLWKEYALSDSRYLTGDVFTLCIEAITVSLVGPLCVLTLTAIIYRHPARHLLQTIVCTAHLQAVILYYTTNWAHGVSYSRPEFLYFWVYYAGFNAPWAIVPLFLLRDSFSHVCRAVSALAVQDQQAKRR